MAPAPTAVALPPRSAPMAAVIDHRDQWAAQPGHPSRNLHRVRVPVHNGKVIGIWTFRQQVTHEYAGEAPTQLVSRLLVVHARELRVSLDVARDHEPQDLGTWHHGVGATIRIADHQAGDPVPGQYLCGCHRVSFQAHCRDLLGKVSGAHQVLSGTRWSSRTLRWV